MASKKETSKPVEEGNFLVRSPLGSVTSVPEELVDRLVESGYERV